jgi:hypothetical protein
MIIYNIKSRDAVLARANYQWPNAKDSFRPRTVALAPISIFSDESWCSAKERRWGAQPNGAVLVRGVSLSLSRVAYS